MRAIFVVCGAAVLTLTTWAQSEAQKGAKALFLDTQTGRVVMPTVARSGADARNSAARVPAITGLMYYLELLTPNGELIRVNSNRTFHSGETVRLHVSSNIDGWLTILQSENGGKFEKLFPTASLPPSVSNIKKGVDTVLPGAGGWFKFDERPGEIRLLMMLTAEPVAAPVRLASAVDQTAESMLSTEKLQRGSKALLVETGDSPQEGYEVRVVNSAQDRKVPPGQIVVELKLQHSPRA